MTPTRLIVVPIPCSQRLSTAPVSRRRMLMGDHTPPRKRFIQTHAKDVKNLDV